MDFNEILLFAFFFITACLVVGNPSQGTQQPAPQPPQGRPKVRILKAVPDPQPEPQPEPQSEEHSITETEFIPAPPPSQWEAMTGEQLREVCSVVGIEIRIRDEGTGKRRRMRNAEMIEALTLHHSNAA